MWSALRGILGGPPRVVLLGGNHRAHLMLDLYALHGNPAIAVIDRGPQDWRHLLRRVLHRHDVRAVDASAVEHVVIVEPPIAYSYEDARGFLADSPLAGRPSVTIYEPGAVDRILAPHSPLDRPGRLALGYRAVYHDLFERAGYAYGMLLAAEEARRVGLSRVTAVEFGVWQGHGLKNLCEIAEFLRQTQGIDFDIYGFDSGEGLPAMTDYRDHPDLWQAGSMKMPDFAKLAAELPPNCHLLIGDVASTVPQFLREQASSAAPVGFVSLDVDLYSSSVSALRLFEAEAEHLLPAVMVWVDDSYINVMQNSFCGEALAIREFNEAHLHRKIDRKIVRGDHAPRLWHHCYYFAHIFDHPVRMGKRPARFDGFFHTSY